MRRPYGDPRCCLRRRRRTDQAARLSAWSPGACGVPIWARAMGGPRAELRLSVEVRTDTGLLCGLEHDAGMRSGFRMYRVSGVAFGNCASASMRHDRPSGCRGSDTRRPARHTGQPRLAGRGRRERVEDKVGLLVAQERSEPRTVRPIDQREQADPTVITAPDTARGTGRPAPGGAERSGVAVGCAPAGRAPGGSAGTRRQDRQGRCGWCRARGGRRPGSAGSSGHSTGPACAAECDPGPSARRRRPHRTSSRHRRRR